MREAVSAGTITAAIVAACLLQVVGAHGHPGVGWHHLAATTIVTVVLAAGATVVALWVLAAGPRVLVAVVRHRRLVRDLRETTRPATIAGHRVQVGAFGEVAFVAGLLRPTTFVDPDRAARLTAPQLQAVLEHEEGHRARRDPLRQLLVATLVAPLVGRTSRGRRWLVVAAARREILADRVALGAGVARASLAGALLVAGEAVREEGVAAFGSATDLRLRALLEGGPTPTAPLCGRAVLVGVGVTTAGVVACADLVHGVLAATVGG